MTCKTCDGHGRVVVEECMHGFTFGPAEQITDDCPDCIAEGFCPDCDEPLTEELKCECCGFDYFN